LSKKEKLLSSAQKFLQKGQIAKAIKDYQKLLEIEPNDIRFKQKLAELYSRNDQLDEALDGYRAVVKHYVAQGFNLKAIAVYRQMQKLSPDEPEFYLALASLNESQGLLGQAVTEYQQLATVYESKGEVGAALDILKKMKILAPEKVNIPIKMAELYARAGLKEKAREDFAEIIAPLKSQADATKLLKLYDIFLPLFPDDLDMRLEYASALIRCDEYERCLEMLRNSLQTHVENVKILQLLAETYRLNKDFGNAKLTSKHLLKLAPDVPKSVAEYLSALVLCGEHSAALDYWHERRDLWGEGSDEIAALRTALEVILAGEKAGNAFLHVLNGQDDGVVDDAEADLGVLEQLVDAEPSLPPLEELDELDELEELEEVEELEELEEVEELDELEELEEVAEHDEAENLEPVEAPTDFAPETVAAEMSLDFLSEALADDSSAVSAEEFVPAPLPDEEDDDTEVELEIGPDDLVANLLLDDDFATDEVLLDSLGEDSSLIDEEHEGLMSFDLDEIESPVAESVQDIEGLLEEAEFYLQQGLYDDADAVCAKLSEAHPQADAVIDKMAQINAARKAHEVDTKPPVAAGGAFMDLAAELNADADIQRSITPLAEKKGAGRFDADDVLSAFRQGVESQIGGEDSETHYNLGIAYREMGLLDDAIASLDKASADITRKADCLTLIGLCFIEKGDYRTSEAVFKEALDTPGLPISQRLSLFYELGLMYQSSGDLESALNSFRDAAHIDSFFRDVGAKIDALQNELGQEDEFGEIADQKPVKDRISFI